MTTLTQHYLLSKLSKGASVADENYKILNADRDLLDLLLYIYGPNHHHDGSSSSSSAPTQPASLVLDQSAGSIPAGTRVFYKYTYVDTSGHESLPSPEAFIDTPAAVADPGAPALSTQPTGGTLLPGAYNYVLSAYRQANSLETRAVGNANISVPGVTSTNKVTLVLPSLPAGAHGFNVYRRRPGGTGYQWIAAIDLTVATPPTTFIDTGLADDCSRGLPNANRTNSQNNITITLPGATPTVPVGSTWKIYRTYITSDYGNSLLHWVVEETSEGSGVITAHYLDLGYNTSLGFPPATGLVLPQPSPINLNNALEVSGTLPPKNVVFRHVVEFAYGGTLTATPGTFAWRCPFEEAYIIEVVINLGKGSAPVTTPVIVDVNKYDSTLATPAWSSIFSENPAHMPQVPVGTFIGTSKVPDVRKLVRGDFLTADIDQSGGSATPNDKDLLVQIAMYVKDTTATSIVFP